MTLTQLSLSHRKTFCHPDYWLSLNRVLMSLQSVSKNRVSSKTASLLESHARSLGTAQIQIWPPHFILTIDKWSADEVLNECHSDKCIQAAGRGREKIVQQEVALNRTEVNCSPASLCTTQSSPQSKSTDHSVQFGLFSTEHLLECTLLSSREKPCLPP